MRAVLIVNDLKDLQLETDVGVIMLPLGKLVGLHIDQGCGLQ